MYDLNKAIKVMLESYSDDIVNEILPAAELSGRQNKVIYYRKVNEDVKKLLSLLNKEDNQSS